VTVVPDVEVETRTSTRKPKTRAATAQDIERIGELTTKDFDIDFDKVVLPQKAEGEPLSVEELDTAVQSFISALQQR